MIMMYIEHKHKDDLFWIMRLSDKDKEEYIESISYAIDKCIKEEYREKFNKEIIDAYSKAFRKVAENYEQLLEGDTDKTQGGRWHGTENAKNQQK